jgi:hypothetical protein
LRFKLSSDDIADSDPNQSAKHTPQPIAAVQRRCALFVVLRRVGGNQDLNEALKRSADRIAIIAAVARHKAVVRQERLDTGFINLNRHRHLAGPSALAETARANRGGGRSEHRLVHGGPPIACLSTLSTRP